MRRRITPFISLFAASGIFLGEQAISAQQDCGAGEESVTLDAETSTTDIGIGPSSTRFAAGTRGCVSQSVLRKAKANDPIQVKVRDTQGLIQTLVSTPAQSGKALHARTAQIASTSRPAGESNSCATFEIIPFKKPSPKPGKPPSDPTPEPDTPPLPNLPENGTSPVSGNAASQLGDTVGEVERIDELARRDELVNAILEAQKAVGDAAEADQAAIEEPFTKLPAAAFADSLSRSESELDEQAKALGSATSGRAESGGELARGEQLRFENIFLNARDKAALGKGIAREAAAREQGRKEVSLFDGLFNPDSPGGPTTLSAEQAQFLKSFFGRRAPAGATTADALVNRLVLLNGLPAAERRALQEKIKLLENAKLTLPGGRVVSIPILHNGYILGGGATGLDCSSFVSQSLPVDVRKGRFTTLDFFAMWKLRKEGRFPSPPKYDPKRARLIKEVAYAFDALDLHEGDPIGAGDLLVYRIPWEAVGHVFVIRSYNRNTLIAEVIEAAQSGSGTVRERSFSLSLDPLDAKKRYIRPGLFGLRIRPVQNKVCKNPGASGPSKGGTGSAL